MKRAPIRVARIITRLNIGGPAIQALSLSERLSAHGFDTSLIHGQLDAGEGDIRTVVESAPVSSVRLGSLVRPIRPLHDLRAFWQVYRQLRRFRPHIVHTHMAKAGLVGRLATLAYNLTRGSASRARTVHTYHGHVLDGYFSPMMSAGVTWSERVLSRLTDRLIAISPRIQDDLERQYRIGRRDQIRVVPLGFDLQRFASIGADPATRATARAELGIPTDQPVITTVGRLTSIKQQHVFVAVGQRLARDFPTITCLVVGDGTLRDALEQQARDRGMANRVRFLGWRSDLPRIYAATDVFVLTSLNEGTPVALIEAMASGVAGVSTDVGGVSDVISGPEFGILAPAGDIEQLASGVASLLNDPERRTAIGQAGRASVLARFGRERLESNIAALYRVLLGSSTAAP